MKTLAFIIGLINTFVIPYVLTDVVGLFNVPFLASLSYGQMFGLAYVVSFFKLSLHLKDIDEESDGEKTLRKSLVSIVMTFIFWGFAYLYSFVL